MEARAAGTRTEEAGTRIEEAETRTGEAEMAERGTSATTGTSTGMTRDATTNPEKTGHLNEENPLASQRNTTRIPMNM